MTVYGFLRQRWGQTVANALVILLHALLIVAVILLSDSDFKSFKYLSL
jgi:hypothetical protein